MPRTKVFTFVATLAAWLALALPVAAGRFPESPTGAGLELTRAAGRSAPISALPPEMEAVTGEAVAPSPPGALASSGTAALPHQAIDGSVRPEAPLPAPRLTLARPFAEAYRQSPEFTYPYGSRGDGRYLLHTGVDIMNPLGTPVHAAADGEVIYAGSDTLRVFGPRPGFYGNLVITRLDGAPEAEPVHVLFGHLDKILVAVGERVSAGDVVGLVGMTGIAIGPHLHLEIRQGDSSSHQATRNPALWLGSLPGRGTLVGKIVDETGRPVAGERLLVYRAERPAWVWRVVRSYEDSPLIHSDDFAQENFALPDMPAGEYRIVAGRAGASIQIPVRIESGRLTVVQIRVQGGQ